MQQLHIQNVLQYAGVPIPQNDLNYKFLLDDLNMQNPLIAGYSFSLSDNHKLKDNLLVTL